MIHLSIPQTTSSLYNHTHLLHLGANTTGSSYDNPRTFTVAEKHPAYVLGECVLRPMIDKVSMCLSRAASFFRYLDKSLEFPMAYGATLSTNAKKQMEFLEKIADEMGKIEEISDAHQRMNALVQEAKNQPEGSDVDFGRRALDIVTDLISFKSSPASFIIDSFLDGVRKHQLNIAFEEIEKLKKKIDASHQGLKDLSKDREAQVEIRRLRDSVKAIDDQINQAIADSNSKQNSCDGIEAEFNKRKLEHDALIVQYNQKIKWHKDMVVYIDEQKNYHQMSPDELTEATSKLQASIAEKDRLKGSIDQARQSVLRLQKYYSDTQDARDAFIAKRKNLESKRDELNQQIRQLQTRSSKDGL